MDERLEKVWVKARNRKGNGYHRALYRTEKGERIWTLALFSDGKVRLRLLWSDGTWHGKDGRTHWFQKVGDSLFVGHLAISVWPFLRSSRSEANRREGEGHES